MNNYFELLKTDLAEQFKGKKNIESLMKVIGVQLNELYDFFVAIKNKTNIYEAEGQQLDGIGDIVCLKRNQANIYKNENSQVDDDFYRKMLLHKIMKNTSNCTYEDIMKTIEMFWVGSPLRYSENPDKSATILFEFDATENLNQKSFDIPLIKAGGVGIEFTMKDKKESNLYIGITKRHLMKLEVNCNEPKSIEIAIDENDIAISDDNEVLIGV